MTITVLGATGHVGAHLTHEALARGHQVRGVARYPNVLPKHPQLMPHRANAADPDELAAACAGVDAVVSAVRFANLPALALIAAVKRSGAARLLVVGGAGSLSSPDGTRVVDTPDFPIEYRLEALAGCDWLDALRAETDLNWTMLSPSAYLHDGPRTGRFRLDGDALLVDSNGESHISVADYATAFIDELEHPRHERRRFTVGY